MISGSREPVNLNVEVKNNTQQIKNYSISIKLNTFFGLDISMLMKEKRIRVMNVGPGQSKDAIFQVYGRYNLDPGFYDSTVVVREHADRFDKVLKEERTKATLRVEAR